MRYDTVVIGAGPAGMAAAKGAKAQGKSTLLVDDNWGPGGQIWRGKDGFDLSGIETRFQSQVAALDIPATQTILATGARELFVPFPGWTLPHVIGAGGLQALVKQGLDVNGKTVVVAGSGPLLLAVAKYLRKAGASVPLVAEQASWNSLIAFGGKLVAWPSKIVEALTLMTPKYRAGLWPVEAVPGGILMSNGESYECDYVACAFGLVPNLELATLAGCRIEGGFVKVNRHMQTSVQGLYAVGELTGIGGVDKAEAEGTAAGSGAMVRVDYASFVVALVEAFTLREELRTLATPQTIVCRCEDVTLGAISRCGGRREAKLQTRCGMGPCQGRICGPALSFLKGWPADTVRPPVYPVPVRDLILK